MEMLLCGRVGNGRERVGETLKDTVGVHTPGLPQAEKLQVMVAELRLQRWSIMTGRATLSAHPPVACHSSQASVAFAPSDSERGALFWRVW